MAEAVGTTMEEEMVGECRRRSFDRCAARGRRRTEIGRAPILGRRTSDRPSSTAILCRAYSAEDKQVGEVRLDFVHRQITVDQLDPAGLSMVMSVAVRLHLDEHAPAPLQ